MRYKIDTTYKRGPYSMSFTKANSLGNEGDVVETLEKIKNKCKENIRNAMIQLINSKPHSVLKTLKE